MEVIPAIDLRDGSVVRARFGRRESYAPIETPLARTSAPVDVVTGLLALYPFRTIYVADLDAIEARGSHDRELRALAESFPAVTFWVDPGTGTTEAARSWLLAHSRAHLVLGSETLRDLGPLEALAGEDRLLLSLDFRDDTFLGPEGLLEVVSAWPGRMIVMTLARVGSGAGPDMQRLAEVARRAPNVKLYAAGGLRDASDLALLGRAGIEGVLVASALHEGTLTRADLAAASREHAGRGLTKREPRFEAPRRTAPS